MSKKNDIDTAPWDEQSAGTATLTEDAPAKPRKRRALASVLSGNILSQSEVRWAYPYMIFVVALMFTYIANAFHTQHVYREYATLTEQVKELRSRSLTIASEKMQATRQSNIIMELERRRIPLRESLTPNKVIPRNNGGTTTEK